MLLPVGAKRSALRSTFSIALARLAVALDAQGRAFPGDADVAVARFKARVLDHGVHDFGQVEHVGRLGQGAHLRQRQRIAHQRVEPFALAFDAVQLQVQPFVLAPRQFHGQLQPRQRRAQLVGDGAQQLFARADQRLRRPAMASESCASRPSSSLRRVSRAGVRASSWPGRQACVASRRAPSGGDVARQGPNSGAVTARAEQHDERDGRQAQFPV